MSRIKKECDWCERELLVLVQYKGLYLCRRCFKKFSRESWARKLKEMENGK